MTISSAKHHCTTVGKEEHIKLPTSRNALKANQHLLDDDDEAFYDIEQYSAYQHDLANYETDTYTAFRSNTSTTPGGRIPDHVWRIMTDENKKAWATMPHDIRSQIIANNNPNPYGSGRPPDSRSSSRFGSGHKITPAVAEEVSDENEAEQADAAAHQNVEHIPMYPIGLPFQKTRSDMSTGPRIRTMIVRNLMLTKRTLLEKSSPRLTACLFHITINSKTMKPASMYSPMQPPTPTPLAATKKDITKAITQSLKKIMYWRP